MINLIFMVFLQANNTDKLTPQERLKRKRQVLLNKQCQYCNIFLCAWYSISMYLFVLFFYLVYGVLKASSRFGRIQT